MKNVKNFFTKYKAIVMTLVVTSYIWLAILLKVTNHEASFYVMVILGIAASLIKAFIYSFSEGEKSDERAADLRRANRQKVAEMRLEIITEGGIYAPIILNNPYYKIQ